MAAGTRRQIGKAAAFWDSSMLVALCVRQGLTPAARSLYKTYEIVVWWATPVEIASALARLKRMQQLDGRELRQARNLAADLADLWWVMQPSEAIRAKASLLIEQHDLRAGDALQLAAALDWCDNQPRGRALLTADRRLREAAMLSGFDPGQL
jgi:predicted nucleic acid-binding protein